MDGEPGDFTMSEGHGHPLVSFESTFKAMKFYGINFISKDKY
jgi:hypothetical protein